MAASSCVNLGGSTRFFGVGADIWFLDGVYATGGGVFVRSRLVGRPDGLISGMYWVDGALTMSADFGLGYALGLVLGLALSS